MKLRKFFFYSVRKFFLNRRKNGEKNFGSAVEKRGAFVSNCDGKKFYKIQRGIGDWIFDSRPEPIVFSTNFQNFAVASKKSRFGLDRSKNFSNLFFKRLKICLNCCPWQLVRPNFSIYLYSLFFLFFVIHFDFESRQKKNFSSAGPHGEKKWKKCWKNGKKK